MTFDDLSTRAMSVTDRVASVTARAPRPTIVTQVDLGAMVFVAGVRKLLDPLSRPTCVVPWFTSVLVISPVTFALVDDVLEVGFGTAIIADRYIAPASAITAVSLSTMHLYLTVMLVVEGSLFGDVLARGIELAGLT